MPTRPFFLALLALLLPGVAPGFDPGQVYWAAGECVPSCGLMRVLPGSQAGTSPLAAIGRAPGQIAFRGDPLAAHLTQFSADTILRITAGGAVSTFASGIDRPTGLLQVSDGRLLVVSFGDGTVLDASAGGDLGGASPFASGFAGPRNLLELSTGEILLGDQTRRVVYDISAGGDFTSATPFASGLPLGPFDLVEDASGQLFASTTGGVFEISAGGDFTSAAPHATGLSFVGLAVDPAGRLLASDLDSGDVFDITAGGDYFGAPSFSSDLTGAGDTALDTVPGAAAVVGSVPALGSGSGALLAALLLVSARARLRRRHP